MIKVINKNSTVQKEKTIYIGRPSVLGNPYLIGKDGDRSKVIFLYRSWLHSKIKLKDKAVLAVLDEIRKIEKKHKTCYLVCWCKPLPCHGDVIKEILDNE